MILMTTTENLDGFRIVEYLGIVSGESAEGMNAVRDLFAQFRNVFGGRTGGYEIGMSEARTRALEQLSERAMSAGAHAVIGLSIDYEFIEFGSKGGMVMVGATGTAVKIVRSEDASKPAATGFRIGG